MRPEPKEIWLADLGIAAKTRPVVIVSRHDHDPPRDLVIFVPCTTQYRSSKYEVQLGKPPFLQQETWVNVQGIGSLPVPRLIRRLGKVPEDAWGRIRESLVFALDLGEQFSQ